MRMINLTKKQKTAAMRIAWWFRYRPKSIEVGDLGKCVGETTSDGEIKIKKGLKLKDFKITLIHEMIHLCWTWRHQPWIGFTTERDKLSRHLNRVIFNGKNTKGKKTRDKKEI